MVLIVTAARRLWAVTLWVITQVFGNTITPRKKEKKERRKNERKRRTVFLRGSYISCFLKVHFTVSLKGSVHKKSALISFVVVVLFFVVVVRVGN